MLFKEFIRQHPFLRFLLPLIVGIILSNSISIPIYVWQSISVVAFFVLLFFGLVPKYRKSYSLRSVFGFFVFFLCVGSGGFRFKSVNESMKLTGTDSIVNFIGELKNDPIEKRNSIACVFEVQKLKNSDKWSKESALLMLYFQKSNKVMELKAGDLLLLKSRLSEVKNNGNPNEFDYAGYLRTQHIKYSSYVDSLSFLHIGQNQELSSKQIGSRWRNNLLSIYRQNGISGDSFDILAALTLGYKSSIDPEVKRAWADAGAMHVLAVSGLHVGIIYMVMNFVLKFLIRFKRGALLRGLLLLMVLWLYACLTGMSPSVMRSASMFSFIVIGEMIKRKGSVYNSLAISAFFLLLIDPFLLFTVGFQFSYLAVISIVYFQPRFDKIFYIKIPVLKQIWQLTTVSLAAQIGTFPLAVYYFHQFPSYFLLSGYVVISMAAILIYLSALLLVFSPIEFISNSLGWVLQNLVDFMNVLIIKIQNLPGAVLRDLNFTPSQLVLLYGAILSLILLMIYRRKNMMFSMLVILITFQFPSISNLIDQNKREILVFNSRKHSIVGFVENKNALFVVDRALSIEARDRIIKPYLISNDISTFSIDTLKPFELRRFGKKMISIIGEKTEYLNKLPTDLRPDIVIVRSNGLKSTNLLTKEFVNCQIILDASVYQSDRKKHLSSDIYNKFNLFDTQEHGAYICSSSNHE